MDILTNEQIITWARERFGLDDDVDIYGVRLYDSSYVEQYGYCETCSYEDTVLQTDVTVYGPRDYDHDPYPVVHSESLRDSFSDLLAEILSA